MNKSFPEYIYTYELDLVPEREIQSWEIMNACYLEVLDMYPDFSNEQKSEIFKVLLLLSMGMIEYVPQTLNEDFLNVVKRLWSENYYE